MKKIIKTLLVVMVLAVVLTAFTACDVKGALNGIIPPELTCTVLGHKSAGPANCTEDEVCARCYTVITEASGHDIVVDELVQSTCTEPGKTEGSHCTKCDSATVPQTEVPAKGHKYVDGVCSVCTYEHEHEYVETVVPTSCIKGGYTLHECSCGLYYITDEVEVDPAAHAFAMGMCNYCYAAEYIPGEYDLVVDEALHTVGFKLTMVYISEAGHYYFSTSASAKSEYVTLWVFTTEVSTSSSSDWADLSSGAWAVYSATGHAYLEPGYYYFGVYYLNLVEAGTYDLTIEKVDCTNKETVTKQPTCTEAGAMGTECTVCGHKVDGVEIPALGHNAEGTVAHKDATCTEAGVTGGTYCTACNDGKAAAEATIDALGHKDENGDFLCDANCGAVVEPAADSVLTIEQAVALADALGANKYSNNMYYITATITSIYNTTFGNANVEDASGNKYVFYGMYTADKTRYDAMTTKPIKGDEVTIYGVVGSYQKDETSSVSYQVKDGVVSAHVAHEHNYESKVTAPTCVADGYTTHTCTICDSFYTDSKVNALGHTTEDGVCGNCGNTIGNQPDAPTLGNPVNVTMKHTSSTTTNLSANTDCATNMGLDDSLFNVYAIQGTPNYNIGLNKAGDFRLYAYNNDGNTLSVEIAEGYVITSIEITFAGSSYAKNCQVKVDGEVVTTTTGSTTVTVDINSDSFELFNGNSDSTQVRISSVKITYAPIVTD